MISKGYIALFKKTLSEELIAKCVSSWLERFERIEQVCPGEQAGAVTLTISKPQDVLMEKNPQFRVLHGNDFAWIYLTKDRYVIETTGLPEENATLSVEVLLELPEVVEIIDQHDDRRLDQLEAEGLM